MRKKGVTLIEIMIVVALVGIFGFALYRFFKNTFTVWDDTFDQIGAQQPARIAMDEMAKYIRQAKPLLDGTTPYIRVDQYDAGEASSSCITFYISTTTPPMAKDLRKYYKHGDALYRVAGSDTTTVIREGLSEIYFVLDSTMSPTQVQITSMTLTKGDRSIVLDRKVDLRNK